jgi:hypothetical protein
VSDFYPPFPLLVHACLQKKKLKPTKSIRNEIKKEFRVELTINIKENLLIASVAPPNK